MNHLKRTTFVKIILKLLGRHEIFDPMANEAKYEWHFLQILSLSTDFTYKDFTSEEGYRPLPNFDMQTEI